MKIGLQVYHFNWPGHPQNIGTKLKEIASTADAAGFASLWFMDHFFQIDTEGFGVPEDPMLEGYTALAYLAAVTQKVRLGLMVTGNYHRYPGVLIKTVTTLDVLSGGRANLGIGAGWCEREARGLGIPYPVSAPEKLGRLEETLQIAHQMWQGDTSPYKGEYYQLDEPMNSPQPLSKPHPPILIGGGGEKVTLRLVAKYGDASNLHLGTPLPEYGDRIQEWYYDRRERLPHKLQVLQQHCDDIERNYDEIEKTVLGTVKLAPDAMSGPEVIDLCGELTEMGFNQVIFNMPNVHDIQPLEIFGLDIIPVVNEMV
jgi:F420-dependent oxidoreductase-like protein